MDENTKNQNMLPMIIGAILIIGIAGAAYYFTQMRNQANTQTDSMMAEGSENTNGDMVDGTTLEIDPTQKEFEVEGGNFTFSVPEMRVKKGDTVKVTFINNEGMHDWRLDEFNAATNVIQAGQSEEITFVADKVGEFEYYCSVGQHRANGMVGKFIVEE